MEKYGLKYWHYKTLPSLCQHREHCPVADTWWKRPICVRRPAWQPLLSTWNADGEAEHQVSIVTRLAGAAVEQQVKWNGFKHPSSQGWSPTLFRQHAESQLVFKKNRRTLLLHPSVSCLCRDGTVTMFAKVMTSFTCRRLNQLSSPFSNSGFSALELNCSLKTLLQLISCWAQTCCALWIWRSSGGWIWFSWTCRRTKLFLLHYPKK